MRGGRRGPQLWIVGVVKRQLFSAEAVKRVVFVETGTARGERSGGRGGGALLKLSVGCSINHRNEEEGGGRKEGERKGDGEGGKVAKRRRGKGSGGVSFFQCE